MSVKRKRELQPKTAAESLRKWRKAKGWTRREAASHLNVSPRTLESWEQGYRQPPAGLRALEALWGTRKPE